MSELIPPDAYVLIIGAMKCGTSSLYDYLSHHPEICPARTKEPEFFSEKQLHRFDVRGYEELWQFSSAKHKYVMEASTGYTKYPYEKNVPEKISKYGIRPKFIYIIRNPFDRISSHYNFMIDREGWGVNIDDDQLMLTSNYFLQLDQYLRYFNKNDFLVLDFDDLISAPDKVLSEIYHFLRLCHTEFPQEYAVRNKTRRKSQALVRLKASRLGQLASILPGPGRRGVTKILRYVFPPPKKRVLTDAEREIIRAELEKDMARLYHTFGFDVRKWGFDV